MISFQPTAMRDCDKLASFCGPHGRLREAHHQSPTLPSTSKGNALPLPYHRGVCVTYLVQTHHTRPGAFMHFIQLWHHPVPSQHATRGQVCNSQQPRRLRKTVQNCQHHHQNPCRIKAAVHPGACNSPHLKSRLHMSIADGAQGRASDMPAAACPGMCNKKQVKSSP